MPALGLLHRLSLVVVNGGYSLVKVQGFLTGVASLVLGHGPWGLRTAAAAIPGLWSTGSVVVEHGLSCSEACGIFPDQGSNPCLLHERWILYH